MAEKTMKIKNRNIYILVIAGLFVSCKERVVEYNISDSYSGPGVIFVIRASRNANDTDAIFLSDGIGHIGQNKMKRKFIFKSLEIGKEIEIIPIGEHDKVDDSVRYVFRLTKDVASSDCTHEKIHKISFFVGLKSEMKKWADRYDDELQYFESYGVDWCRYYRAINPDSVNK